MAGKFAATRKRRRGRLRTQRAHVRSVTVSRKQAVV